MLLHLADSVRNLGPLWCHSAFPFEDMNGWLGDLYHGTRDPQKQVHIAIPITILLSTTYDSQLHVYIYIYSSIYASFCDHLIFNYGFYPDSEIST